MKTFHWLFLVFVVLCCFSCKQNKSEFTPYIQVSYFYLNPVYEGEQIVSARDTLSMYNTDGTYVLDSVNVGDTIAFYALFGSYTNDLIATRILFDTTQLDMYPKLPQEIQAILLPESDVRTIQLLLNPGYNGLSFPVIYKPLKSGTYQFRLQVESDSQFSPSVVQFEQPVR